MNKYLQFALVFLFLFQTSCEKKEVNEPIVNPPEIMDNSNADARIKNTNYFKDLLLVDRKNYQIETTEEATFSATGPHVAVSTTGLISRITSGELVVIDITWTKGGGKTKLYALGATDNDHIKPFSNFHDVPSDDPYKQYLKGWETLRTFQAAKCTYFIVLRHADADNGKDYKITSSDQGPANWWMSCDNSLARQLNQQGIDRAKELGNVFRDLKLPISRVISSEFCRAVSTAELMDVGPQIVKDGRINHPAYLKSGKSLFKGLQEIIKEQPVDNKMTLISTHHPINEFKNSGIATFPQASAFNWTGAYIVKVNPDKTFTYEGAISYGMFKYWRDKKLSRL